MHCPACHTVLIVVEREGIELDWCPDCSGLWFDEGELVLLGEKAGRPLEAEHLGGREGDTVERGKRRCPRCPRKMKQVGMASGDGERVQIDRCDEHGIWLDRGELGAILSRTTWRGDPEEDLMLDFLGETFGRAVPPDDTPNEGRRP
jgi:Zn-finger nucleic acid-binding protein